MKKILFSILRILLTVIGVILSAYVIMWLISFINLFTEPISTSGEILHEYRVPGERSGQSINIVKSEREKNNFIVQIVLNKSTGAGEYENPVIACSNFKNIELSDITESSAVISVLTRYEQESQYAENTCELKKEDVIEYSFINYEE
jgi:hypothetical protein